MADDMFDAEDDVVATEEAQPGQKRVGFLPGVLIQVLKWTGIILAAIIFIVTVVVITVRVLNRGNTAQVRAPISQDYEANTPRLEYYGQIGELRGVTGDEVRTTFVVQPYLGYRRGNDGLATELIDRRIQLIGLFNEYFGTRLRSEMEGGQGTHRQRVERELIEQINNLLEEGTIDDIVFSSYQFLEF